MLLLALTAAAAVVLEAADAGVSSDTPSDVPAASSAQGSVYVLDPWTDGIVLGATTTSWIVLSVVGPSWVTPHCPCDAAQVPSFDRVALHWHSQAAEVASNVTEVLALLAPLGVDLVDVGLGQALFEDMVVYAEVLSISGTATVTQTLRHGLQVWPWLLMGLVGTSVAVERVLAGQHFPSDVVVGAAVGIGTGVLVSLLHRRETAAEPQVKLVFRPGGAGLEVSGPW